MRILDRALSWAEFAGGLPSELMFLWLQPRCTEGLCLSKEGRKALRGAVGIIKRMLSERGFLPANIPHLARIYHLDVLHTAV